MKLSTLGVCLSLMAIVTAGKVFAPDEKVTREKLNQLGVPTVQLDEGEVGARELDAAAVAQIVRDDDEISNILNYASLKNVIINPLFQFWTRLSEGGPDTYVVSEGEDHRYAADRWVIPATPGRTWQRVAFPLGQTEVPDFPQYMLRWTQASPLGVNPGYLGQRVEGVATFAGETVTWAIYVKATSAITVQMQLSQYFGFGGSPSATVNTTAQSYVLVPGVWTKLVYTVELPSVAGKVVGNTPNWLEARCIMPQGTTFEIDFAHAQLQLGNNADNFEFRPHSVDISLCNLYFERTQAPLASNVATHRPAFYYNTPKRAIPTPIISSVSAGTGATIAALAINGFYQTGAHSELAIAVVLADAELYLFQ